ncbi:AAA family ATPase [Nocardioides sp.]|uniref:AAA family ATPase n=1 Tax=Nocardioides sp. TaxID=35761 RepID=UPI0035141120
MRLHQLRIEAFGPFAEPVEIDLDALSAAGLFLLTGPTGAGKTSVLDAVCFALFGDVPGDRATAKRLRCDHAAPSAVPRVVLEATLGGRRFRIERSPAWARPKKRGTGTTPEQARVVLTELVDGAWTPRSSRIDEAADLLGDVLGLTLSQFTQIAMLPQGRFQQFLRARADERHQVLARVFRTERFDHLETWLREHRRALGREEAALRAEVDDLSSRVSESAAAPVPDDLAVRAAWAADLRRGAEAEAADTAERLDLTTRAEEAARHEVVRRREDTQRWQRWQGALAEQAELDAASADHAAALARLAPARRAAPVPAWLDAHADAALALAAAQADVVTAREHGRAALDALPADTPLGALPSRLAEVESLLGTTRSVVEVLTRLERAHELALTAHAERSASQDALDAATDRAARADRTLAAVRARWEVRERLARWEQRAEVATAWSALLQELELARTQVLTAQEVLVRSKDHLLQLQEARLTGMAAELAVGLAVGGCCPVCGSREHPEPAGRAADAPDAAAERLARAAVADAESALLVAREGEQGVTPRLERLLGGLEGDLAREASAGHDAPLPPATPGELLDLVAAARREALRALADLDDGPDRPAALPEHAAAELESAQHALQQCRQRHAAAEAAVDAHAATLTGLGGELRHLLGAPEAPTAAPSPPAHDAADQLGLFELADLTASSPLSGPATVPDTVPDRDEAARLRAALETVAATLGALAAAQRALTAAAEREEEARRQAERAVTDAGFADAVEAAAAALPPAEVAELERRVTEVEQRRASLAARLEDLPEDGLPAAPPKLADAEQAHAVALEAARTAHAAHRAAAHTAERLAVHEAELATILDRYTPLAQRLAAVTHLAAFVEGRSSDNRARMRLSAYVLAHRLSQVVAAANERLAGMSDRRYHLLHLAERGAGDTRGGLTLAVRDDWSGETRDPATLSGGETFVVSLALALGLADVISDEAGGARLDTLFVDEGFGSLDADTLDDVLDTLDTLRDGGRVVGVVSHVGEMRERITTQLVVHKARHGSTLSVRL